MSQSKIAVVAVLISALYCGTCQADLMFDNFVAVSTDQVVSSNLIGYAFTVAGTVGVTTLDVTGLGALDLSLLGIPPEVLGSGGLTVSLTEVAGVHGEVLTPLASVTISTADPFHPFTVGDYDVPGVAIHGFRIEDLGMGNEVTLLAGNTYVVFADYSTINGEAAPVDNELLIDSTSFTQNSAVDFLSYDDLNAIFPGGVFNDPQGDTTTFGLTATPSPFSPIPFGGTGSNPIGPTIVFGSTAPPMPGVPEPSSMALLGLVGVALLARVRRRKTE